MLVRILGSKWLVTVVAVTVVSSVIAGALFYARKPAHPQTAYCALMPDAVGLYVGNPVTRLGTPIGRITAITPRDEAVRVEFDIDADQHLPSDVGAVTVSESLIASRQLALIGTPPSGPGLAPGHCITNTKTPQSLSSTIGAIGDAAEELTSAGGPAQAKQVRGAVKALAAATRGSGDDVNGMIAALARLLDNPGPGMGDIAQTLDAVSSLTGGMTANWSPLKSLLTTTPSGLANFINPMASTVETMADALIPIGKTLESLIAHYGHNLWPLLDGVLPLTRILNAGIKNWGDLLRIIPPVIDAFNVRFDQRTLGLRIEYSPPSTVIPAENGALTCANINRIVPGQCRVIDASHIDVDVLSTVLKATGVAR